MKSKVNAIATGLLVIAQICLAAYAGAQLTMLFPWLQWVWLLVVALLCVIVIVKMEL